MIAAALLLALAAPGQFPLTCTPPGCILEPAPPLRFDSSEAGRMIGARQWLVEWHRRALVEERRAALEALKRRDRAAADGALARAREAVAAMAAVMRLAPPTLIASMQGVSPDDLTQAEDVQRDWANTLDAARRNLADLAAQVSLPWSAPAPR